MIVSVDGPDGAGKTTFINNMMSELITHHCTTGKERVKGNILDLGQRNRPTSAGPFGDEAVCCPHKCIIKLKNPNFGEGLLPFKESILSRMGCTENYNWEAVVREYINYCLKEDFQLFRKLFYFPFLRITEIARKNPNSIIFSDRYILSDLVYKQKNYRDLEKVLGYEKNIKQLIQEHLGEFDLDDFPFSDKEKSKYLKNMPMTAKLPEIIFCLTTNPSLCLKNIKERAKEKGDKNTLKVYETEEELEDKYLAFKSFIERRTELKIYPVDPYEARCPFKISELSSGIKQIWEDLNAPLSEKIIEERAEKMKLFDHVWENNDWEFDRYQVSFKGKEAKVTSPTKLIGAVTDFKEVDRYYLKLKGMDINKTLSLALEKSDQRDIQLNRCISNVMEEVRNIQDVPMKTLMTTANIGTQTHRVIEKIIDFIIENDNGSVEKFNERSVINIVNDMYDSAKIEAGSKWIEEKQWALVQYFLKYQNTLIKRWIGSEILVYDDKAGVAGRFDAIAETKKGKIAIVDFKTSSRLRKSHYKQIILYYCIIQKYFKSLLYIMDKNGGVLTESDLATLKKDTPAEKKKELKSILNFFKIKNFPNLSIEELRYGHLVHLDKKGQNFVCSEVDFKKMKTLEGIKKFDSNLLKSLKAPFELYNSLTDIGRGKNKKGVKTSYANFTRGI